MPLCFFATDLHGRTVRYENLLAAIAREHPTAVFLGGDLLPGSAVAPGQPGTQDTDFFCDYLAPAFRKLRATLGAEYPDVFLILGNDDPRSYERIFMDAAAEGLWHYMHGQKAAWKGFRIFGLSYVPPTPFLLKDWERYDVSRYVPPGSVSPEEGNRTIAAEEHSIKWGTIQKDLAALAGDDPMDRALFLFHTPPADTTLDRAALDGNFYEHVPVDVHVGSVAVRRFIEERQPWLTLHGHVHESAHLTGEWKIRLGRTVCINGAHDGPELSLVRLDLDSPEAASRELL
ncbi:MAG TPA: metallophosphoesterase [Candidatus Sulfotelmatobacter sp.]|nr:metallophosphoesterase [Candidatus Sulfotelmatobacter sp.]